MPGPSITQHGVTTREPGVFSVDDLNGGSAIPLTRSGSAGLVRVQQILRSTGGKS